MPVTNWILFLLIQQNYQLLITQFCSCSQLLSQSDCITSQAQCKYENKNCENYPCSSFINQTSCTAYSGCAWNDQNECEDFSFCSNYQVEAENQSIAATNCFNKYNSCTSQKTPDSNGNYSCQTLEEQNKYYVCEELDQDECQDEQDEQKLQADGRVCWYNGTMCTSYDATQCSNIVQQKRCTDNNCIWNVSSNNCSYPICSDLAIQTDCTFIRGDIVGTLQLCVWNTINQECDEADEESLYEAYIEDCLVKTNYTATNNGTGCVLCTRLDGVKIFIQYLLLLLLI